MDDALTAKAIKTFESEQQAYGTKVALFNLLWLKATADLHAIGVRHVTTRTTRTVPKTARRVGPAYRRGLA